MSITKWFIKKGMVYTLNTPNADNGFDLLKWLRQSLLSYLNVAYYDNCCDTGKTSLPVRFDTVTQKLQYFNGTTWTKAPSTALT